MLQLGMDTLGEIVMPELPELTMPTVGLDWIKKLGLPPNVFDALKNLGAETMVSTAVLVSALFFVFHELGFHIKSPCTCRRSSRKWTRWSWRWSSFSGCKMQGVTHQV